MKSLEKQADEILRKAQKPKRDSRPVSNGRRRRPSRKQKHT